MQKENKRKFNIFVSILTCFIITLACLSPSFISCADGNPRLVDLYDISNSPIENKDTDFPFLKSDSSDYTVITDFYNSTYNDNGFTVPSSALVSVDDFPHYVLICESREDWKFILLPEDTFLVGNSSGYAIYVPVESQNSSVTLYGYLFDHYNTWQEIYLGYRNSQHWGPSANATVDGDKYYKLFFRDTTSAWGPVLSSDVPCYESDSLNITSLDGLKNVNSSVSSGGVSKADIQANNLLKQGSKIYLTNNSFNVGNLMIYPVLTETQSDNLNAYKLRLTGTCTYGIQYNSGASNKCMVNGSSLQSLYGFNGSSINSVRGTLASNLGDYIDISFSLLSSGKYSMTLDQLNSHFKVSGRDKGIQPLASGLDNTYGGYTYWQAMAQSVGGQSIMGFQYFNTNDGQSMYDCVPTSAHYIIEAWVVADDVQATKPCSVIDVDLVTGEVTPIVENYASDEDIMSAMGSDTLPDGYGNYNSPVNPSAMQGAITNGATANSGGNVGNSTIESGAIVINNNPTFNNNNNLESDGNSGLIPFLLGMIASNQKSSVNTIQDISGANGWLSVISQTWSFIPTQIWNVLLTTFTAVIGICVVAFILSIVIRFIT